MLYIISLRLKQAENQCKMCQNRENYSVLELTLRALCKQLKFRKINVEKNCFSLK